MSRFSVRGPWGLSCIIHHCQGDEPGTASCRVCQASPRRFVLCENNCDILVKHQERKLTLRTVTRDQCVEKLGSVNLRQNQV